MWIEYNPNPIARRVGDFRRLMENAPDEQTRAEPGRMMQRYE